MDFRDKLRKAMKDLNLNQRQIAGMTGFSKAAVLGIGKETVRKGLQQGCFPWGYAIHMDSGKWVYLINADKLEEIEGVKI